MKFSIITMEFSIITPRRYQYCGLNLKQIKYNRYQNLTSKHQAVKKLLIAKSFSKNGTKEGI